MVDEDCGFGDCASDDATCEILQENYFGLDQDVDLRVRASYYFVGFAFNTLLHYYLFANSPLQSRDLNPTVPHTLELLSLLSILHSKIFVPPRELELLFGF